jgi:hypothetical protein
MKTKQQEVINDLYLWARATIGIKQTDVQIAALAKRLMQIMNKGNAHPEARQIAAEAVDMMTNYHKTPGPAQMTGLADNYEKIHHDITTAEYLRATARCCAAFGMVDNAPKSNNITSAATKAYRACGLIDEIKIALMLIF